MPIRVTIHVNSWGYIAMTEDSGTDNRDNGISPKKYNSAIKKAIRHHLVYTVFFSLLFTLLDFVFVWPEYHLLALLALAAAFSAVGWAELPRQWAIWSAVALFVMAGAVRMIVGPELPTETETHGWLLAANDPIPPNACSDNPRIQVPSDAILFIAGTNGIWTNEMGRSTVLTVGNSTILSMERNGDRLSFDADIFDNVGNLVARITKNEFNLVPGEYSYRERSEDRSTLAVYDRKGREMLYIRYVAPSVVVIRGLFTSPDGTKVQIRDKSISLLNHNGTVGGNCLGGFSGDKTGFRIYPNGITTY